MKDEEIVGLFWKRSERAVEETQNKYERYCTYISRNILGNDQDAEECVNEALNAAWNSIPPQKPGNFKAYIGKLTREISISRWRQNHAAKRFTGEFAASLDEIEEIAVDDDFVTDVQKEQVSKSISDFLRTLPETERIMLIRRYWYGDSIKSICERFDFSEGKVKVGLQRTRQKLKKYLMKEGWIT
ncbi:MAG: RNA polymerase sigma factor [Clostridia bacterium]|nr:RNA polymerase sigma factor [Clostridia bacterium]